MKKFTKLDEELLKENATATERFNEHYNNSLLKIDMIKNSLTDMKIDYDKNQGNWGFVGSMYHCLEILDDLCEFLNIKDMIKDSEKYNI